MNIYKMLNQVTEYIDENLDSPIKDEVLAKMLGVNIYTMKRLFSLLTNISLTEYIRKRRLSNAGFDLYQLKMKVMDVAVKYQYDNATSFSRAFQTFHGVKPSKVNKETKLKVFPRIIFNEKLELCQDIEYKVISLEKLELYGIGIDTDNNKISKDAPKFFKEALYKYFLPNSDIKYGMVIYDEDRCNCTKYVVLTDKKIERLEKFIIPSGKYLQFRIDSRDSSDIQKMSNKFYLEFLPSCKYNLRPFPELEYYHDDVVDFLVPIY